LERGARESEREKTGNERVRVRRVIGDALDSLVLFLLCVCQSFPPRSSFPPSPHLLPANFSDPQDLFPPNLFDTRSRIRHIIRSTPLAPGDHNIMDNQSGPWNMELLTTINITSDCQQHQHRESL
jgi:hypothetical protein